MVLPSDALAFVALRHIFSNHFSTVFLSGSKLLNADAASLFSLKISAVCFKSPLALLSLETDSRIAGLQRNS